MNLFDNSNLNESYSGVTSPLTYSFAVRVYGRVYIALCSLFGVSQKDMKDNKDLFPNMLAYIGGRMYYNLLNWYKMISLLPGYKFNRTFLEQMLGVEEEYRYEKKKKIGMLEKLSDFYSFALRIGRMIFIFIFMKYFIERFSRKFESAFSYLQSIDLTKKSDAELVSFYEEFEAKLAKDFSIPIANDFAVMISIGILKNVAKKWLADINDTKANFFISGRGKVKSAKPGLMIEQILRDIGKDSKIKRLFTNKSSEKILLYLNEDQYFKNIKKKIIAYTRRFGYRVPGELKLESLSFQDNPLTLISLLKNGLSHSRIRKKVVVSKSLDKEVTRLPFFKRRLFLSVVSWARSSISRREDTRFKRTLVFSVARRVFQESGKRLFKMGAIHSATDVFYLQTEEIFSALQQRKKQKNYLAVVRKRKKLDAVWRSIAMPRRIVTEEEIGVYERKIQALKIQKRLQSLTKNTQVKGQLASIGNGSSAVSGRSLVLTDFDPTCDFRNKILVTQQTDPGWTIIFPALKGLVVERGGVLSHAAVVAREFGIPCIINAKNATKSIPDGRNIKMNLTTGAVTIIQ